jgi:hypothetical protein
MKMSNCNLKNRRLTSLNIVRIGLQNFTPCVILRPDGKIKYQLLCLANFVQN